jgi:Skp family chaperone for outer membrane proteins
MYKENVGIDYECECNRLMKEICRIKEEYDMKLKYMEEQKIADERKLNEEIEWLKKVISGILHI